MVRYVTTAIPYVNAKPHVGQAFEYVQADTYVRALRLKGEEVRFLSGTDDNALKNVQAAEKAGKPIVEYIEENAQHFIELDRRLDVRYDDFIRTSVDVRHREGAQKLWRDTNPEDIYKKSYKGFYCIGCEEFKTEKDLVNGECPEHPGTKLEEVEEENYFFRLSAYQDRLKTLIQSGEISIVPESRKNETLAFIEGGLEDFSISRSAVRAKGWGIQVPDDPDQYMYVWYDALANYITALGYAEGGEQYQKYWLDAASRVHMIGKGINRFHTLYWPAMLMSAGVPLPTQVFIHGYITSNGQKMSKTLGNVIDPNDLLDRYGTDAVRYFLLRHAHPTEDFDMTVERCDEWYTGNLVNGLGNLVARVMKLAETHLPDAVARPAEAEFPEGYWETFENFEFSKAADLVWKRIQEVDERITSEEPFKVVKEDAERGQQIIRELAEELYLIARLLNPFMPLTSAVIKKAVLENKKPENLFPRLS